MQHRYALGTWPKDELYPFDIKKILGSAPEEHLLEHCHGRYYSRLSARRKAMELHV
jgi:hypothetical protein